ncbi:MAG: hypothetical protein JWQ43_922 [Glaciihabitans sp.]|nr:hypothetical protein [Glaciihabitans sp.]
MNTVLSILSVFPEACNVNGDSENAAVLAARSRWAGHSARVIRRGLGEQFPAENPGLVVFGSCSDAAVPRVLAQLAESRDLIERWIADGVPILAVGTGWEMLTSSIELEGSTVDGLGLIPGRAVTAPSRVSDDLVITSPFGRLIGYENNARDMVVPAGTPALGEVVYGRGNGGSPTEGGVRYEGVLIGATVGTHLHGPVTAKNPGLADHLLSIALGAGYDSRTVPAGRVDDIAKAARNVIATRLGLNTDA